MQKIATSLLKARRAFGPALKDKTNPAFRSKYADLSACLEAVETPCVEAGIFLYQETFEDATGVTVETVFLHESGEALRCGKLHVPAAKQDPQGYGSALTYARRYSLMTACGIAPEDDDGNAASKPRSAIPETFKSSPTMGVLATLQPARQAIISDCADAMRERYAADDLIGAYEIAMHITDSEEKTALWGVLAPDSKLRAAIKKHSDSLKQPQKAAA